MTPSTRAARRLLFAAGLCLCIVTPAARAQTRGNFEDLFKNGPKVMAAFRDVVAKASRSTVRVRCDGKDVALGTVVGADGYILTKASELSGKTFCKFKDGRSLEARIVGVHEPYDLALLKVEAKDLTPVEWRDSKGAAPGHWLASAGTGDLPVAVGVVSVASRAVPLRDQPPARALSKSGYLGVQLRDGQGGAQVALVVRNGPAYDAGLQADDVIVAVDGKPITGSEDLVNAIQGHSPKESVVVRFKRGDEEKEVKATLAQMPKESARADFQNRMGGDPSDRRGGFPTYLQHDTVLKPSDCGGPVVDLDGKVVGINIARIGRTESAAVPWEDLRALLPDLISGKLAPKDGATEKVSTDKK